MERSKRREFLKFVLAYHVVLFVPILIISFSVLRLIKNQQHHRMDREAAMMLERQESFWLQQMSVIRAFNARCKFDKKYNELYTHIPSVYLDIEEQLEQQERNFPFAEGICVVDPDKQIILTSQGIVTQDLFFRKICQTDMELLSGEEDFRLRGEEAILRGGSGIALAAAINTWGQEGANCKYILYMVSDRTLKEQFGGGKGIVTLLNYDGHPIYASEQEERLAGPGREWRQLEEEYFIYEKDMGDGFEIVCLAEKSEIASGMEIYLKAYGIWLLCSLGVGIVLAFAFSGNRYRDYRRILDYSQELEEERNALKQKNCLYSLLSGEIRQGDEVWDACLDNGIWLNHRYKFFVVVPEDVVQNRRICECLDQQVCGGNCRIYGLEAVEGVRAYLLCSDEEMKGLRKRIDALVKKGIRIGVGKTVEEAEELHRSYREAKRQYDTFHQEERAYPRAELQALQEALAEEEPSRAAFLLKDLMEYVQGAQEMGIWGILWDAARLFGQNPHPFMGKCREAGKETRESVLAFLAELEALLPKEGEEEKETPASYRKKSIVDLLRYIHEHFLDDNFSVKYLAAYFDTTPSNISHFFKKNMDVTISQYIEQIKLERAKELLLHSDKMISEIAEELCYSNSTVFIEMFKKNEGVTPGMYREKHE